MRRSRFASVAMLIVTLAACGGGESGPGSAGTKPQRIETHSVAAEGVFAGTRWRLKVTSDGKGATCRADVELPDDGPRGVDAGQCLSLDRLEDFLVVDQGIESKGSLSYAAGLHSRRVKQVRIVFKDGSSSAGPVEGDVFLALWAGTGNASRIEFLSDDGRVLAKCNFAGDRDPC